MINLETFNNFRMEQEKQLTNPSVQKAFENADWGKWAKTIEDALLKNFENFNQQFTDTDQPCLVIDLRWDDYYSKAAVMIDADMAQNCGLVFPDGVYDNEDLFSIFEFVEKGIGIDVADFDEVIGEDYDIVVEIFSKLTREVFIQITSLDAFKNIKGLKEIFAFYSYYDDGTPEIFFDSNGEILENEDLWETMPKIFEKGDIETIVNFIPKAVASGFSMEVLMHAHDYVLKIVKNYHENIEELKQLLEALLPFKKLFIIDAYTYEKTLSNALCVPVIDNAYIALIESMIPEQYSECNLAFNMACTQARLGKKEAMLSYVSKAIDLGKAKESFMSDSDFSAYVDDSDFIEAMDNGSIAIEVLNKDMIDFVKRGKFEEAMETINKGADVNATLDDELYETVMEALISTFGKKASAYDFLIEVLDKGLEITFDDLTSAVRGKNIQIVDAILDEGVLDDINDKQKFELLCQLCMRCEVIEIFELIKERNFDYTLIKEEETALFLARQNDSEAVIDFLLEEGVDVNQASVYGKTALHFAASANNLMLINKLIDKGIDINHRSNDGNTAMNDAFFNDNADVIKLLIEKGADLTVQDNEGNSLTHQCIREGAAKCLRVILKNNPNLDHKNNNGLTSLEFAKSLKKITMAKSIMKYQNK